MQGKLVEVTPEIIAFSLEDEIISKTKLKLKNLREHVCVFKVKTTKPKVYVVKPNQGVLLPGQETEVFIVLNNTEKIALLEKWREAGKPQMEAGLVHDKFLIQSSALSSEEADKLARLEEGTQRIAELVKMWPSFASEKIDSRRFVVQYHYPSKTEDTLLKKPSSSTLITAVDPAERNKNQSEGAALQKKYEDLIKFTVQITEEKESLVSLLETTKANLKKEIEARKEAETVTGELKPAKPVPSIRRKNQVQQQKGFSLFFLALVGASSFYLGQRYGPFLPISAMSKPAVSQSLKDSAVPISKDNTVPPTAPLPTSSTTPTDPFSKNEVDPSQTTSPATPKVSVQSKEEIASHPTSPTATPKILDPPNDEAVSSQSVLPTAAPIESVPPITQDHSLSNGTETIQLETADLTLSSQEIDEEIRVQNEQVEEVNDTKTTHASSTIAEKTEL